MTASSAEKVRVEINGFDQGMFIEGRDPGRPVLLFVHGGPGMPEHWLTQWYPTGLDRDFTVVWWDQRGAGLSYAPDIPPETMTVEQLISDLVGVTRYLQDRFDHRPIHLLGHSWGSFLGIQAVARHPELFATYIGVGQVVDQIESEQLAYRYALRHFETAGNRRMLRKLEAAPPSDAAPLPADYFALRDAYMHAAGIGTMHEMRSVITGIFLPSWGFRGYTPREKVDLWRGKRFSSRPEFGLWNAMLTTDMREIVPNVEIPVWFLHGRYDYTCAYPLAREYAELLRAPRTRFHSFEQSAHSPMFEEPNRTVQILVDEILNGVA